MRKTLDFSSALIGTRYPSDFSLPDFPRDENGKVSREKALDILLREEYGVADDGGVTVRVDDVTDEQADRRAGYSFCGKAHHSALRFTLAQGERTAAFTADIFLPVKEQSPTFVLQLDFAKQLPTKYCPAEELLDRGVALVHLCYTEITSDDSDFSTGIAPLLTDRSKPHCAGKIAVWAYAAGVVGNYLAAHGYVPYGELYVAGHSRLGKTALLACAQHEVFAGCFVNCSGCCGAAISRDKHGETVQKINEVFGYWFTADFCKYNGRENEMPFDQHFLMAAIAPRKICVVAASEDDWADTDAQYLCTEAARIAYAEQNAADNIAFFKRTGPHFFSREDWNFYIDCVRKK